MAFSTPSGHYAPAVFQVLVNDVFQDYPPGLGG